MKDAEIERKLEAWADGDSNDDEIFGLRDIVSDLQEERRKLYDLLEDSLFDGVGYHPSAREWEEYGERRDSYRERFKEFEGR